MVAVASGEMLASLLCLRFFEVGSERGAIILEGWQLLQSASALAKMQAESTSGPERKVTSFVEWLAGGGAKVNERSQLTYLSLS